MYIEINKVVDDMKFTVPIASIGDEEYQLLVNLAIPKEPSTLTFDKAVGYMSQHLQPALSAFLVRFLIGQRYPSCTTKNIAGYVTELKDRGCLLPSASSAR